MATKDSLYDALAQSLSTHIHLNNLTQRQGKFSVSTTEASDMARHVYEHLRNRHKTVVHIPAFNELSLVENQKAINDIYTAIIKYEWASVQSRQLDASRMAFEIARRIKKTEYYCALKAYERMASFGAKRITTLAQQKQYVAKWDEVYSHSSYNARNALKNLFIKSFGRILGMHGRLYRLNARSSEFLGSDHFTSTSWNYHGVKIELSRENEQIYLSFTSAKREISKGDGRYRRSEADIEPIALADGLTKLFEASQYITVTRRSPTNITIDIRELVQAPVEVRPGPPAPLVQAQQETVMMKSPLDIPEVSDKVKGLRDTISVIETNIKDSLKRQHELRVQIAQYEEDIISLRSDLVKLQPALEVMEKLHS